MCEYFLVTTRLAKLFKVSLLIFSLVTSIFPLPTPILAFNFLLFHEASQRFAHIQFVFLQTGLPVRGSYSFERGACLGRMIWRLSPGLFSCKRHSGCSECFGPHDFALVSHLSPSCLPLHSGFSARMISGLSPTCFPVSSGCSEPRDFALVPHYTLDSLPA